MKRAEVCGTNLIVAEMIPHRTSGLSPLQPTALNLRLRVACSFRIAIMGPAKLAISPQCLGLLRRLAGLRGTESKNPFHQQIRGKKKSSKGPHLVTVRLLEDIQGYGRRGWLRSLISRHRSILTPLRQVPSYPLHRVGCEIFTTPNAKRSMSRTPRCVQWVKKTWFLNEITPMGW